MGFGLQFLDGIGSAADNNAFPYTNYENKEITAEQMEDVNNNFQSFSDMQESQTLVPEEYREEITIETVPCKSELWFKRVAIFAAGAIAGQIIKKLFKD